MAQHETNGRAQRAESTNERKKEAALALARLKMEEKLKDGMYGSIEIKFEVSDGQLREIKVVDTTTVR